MSATHETTWEDPAELLSRAASKLRSLWIEWTYPFASIGKGFWVHHSCELSRSTAGYIRLGDSVFLERGASLKVPAVPDGDKPVIILEDGCRRSWNYEVGAKTSWLDQHVAIDGPLLLMDWKNLQQEESCFMRLRLYPPMSVPPRARALRSRPTRGRSPRSTSLPASATTCGHRRLEWRCAQRPARRSTRCRQSPAASPGRTRCRSPVSCGLVSN